MALIRNKAYVYIIICMTSVVMIGYHKIYPTVRMKVTEYGLTAHSMSVDLPNCAGNITEIHSKLEIPIFVLVRDRVKNLHEALQSYKTLSTPWHVIICDHGSTYPPMIKYLLDLKASGVEVWHVKKPSWLEALKELSKNITLYLQQRPHLKYYVFTDPDIGLNGTAPDLLLFLAAVLEACPQVKVIGPSLQISDIPAHYSKKAKVLKRHALFWRTVPATATWDGIKYNIAKHVIDTTFALRRSTLPFRRLRGFAIRTYAPYMATHLGWYMNTSNPDKDYTWYLDHQHRINHWR